MALIEEAICRNCANKDICKYADEAAGMEEAINDLITTETTIFKVQITCTARRTATTYAQRTALRNDELIAETAYAHLA